MSWETVAVKTVKIKQIFFQAFGFNLRKSSVELDILFYPIPMHWTKGYTYIYVDYTTKYLVQEIDGMLQFVY